MDECCDRLHSEPGVILNTREHDGVVLGIRNIADGVHTMIGEVFPKLVFKERKVILLLELLRETSGPVEVGLLGSGN